jgi:hypothetical protein
MSFKEAAMTVKLKAILAGVVAVLVLALGGLIFYSNQQHGKYLVFKARAELMGSQFSELEKKSDAEKAALLAANERLDNERLAAIAKAEKSKQAEAVKDKEIEALKAKTAALPADDLVRAINQRIGDGESWPDARGLFSFTRPGTERTLNLFIDGEGIADKYVAELDVSAKWKSAHDLAIGERDNEKQARQLEEGKVVALKLPKAEIEKALRALERSIPGMKWKSRATGTVFGFALRTVLGLVGVI